MSEYTGPGVIPSDHADAMRAARRRRMSLVDVPRADVREKLARQMRRDQIQHTLAESRQRRERREMLWWLAGMALVIAALIALGLRLHSFEMLSISLQNQGF